MAPVQDIEIVSSEIEPATPVATQDQIAALAYALWQERGCPEGSPDVDWFAAEAKLINKDEK